jgi:uncharacterized protein (TIGR03083 family)
MDAHELKPLTELLYDLRTLVDDLSDEDFARPTRCPGWSVAELVVHCEIMLVMLVGVNAIPAAGEPEKRRVDVYRYDPEGPVPHDPGMTVSQLVRDAVISQVAGRGPGQLREAMRVAVEHALDGLPDIPGDRLIRRPDKHLMTFGELLASRYVEFGIHMMDIAEATGHEESVPPAAAAIITGILDELLGTPLPASIRWDATTYILTGSGRRQLEPAERDALGPEAARFPLLG